MIVYISGEGYDVHIFDIGEELDTDEIPSWLIRNKSSLKPGISYNISFSVMQSKPYILDMI